MATWTNDVATVDATDEGARPVATDPPTDEGRSLAPSPTRGGASVRLDRYTLLHELGRGGMGVVYAAHDERLNRKVAIKLVRHHGDTSAQKRTLEEAQALARLSHPSVVQVYEIGDVDGQTFISMEFVEGCTLRHWLIQRRRSQCEILAAFAAAGRGLAAAHAAGLIHRDFKPDNDQGPRKPR